MADEQYYTLLGVMHFVDKWLDGDELKQDEVQRADTMREKTLRIVEKLQADNAALRAELDAVKRERDAALSLICHSCGTCLYADNSWNDEPCKSCEQNDELYGSGEDNYKWRGAQEATVEKQTAQD